ncbi:hypothetical protein A2U01_0064481, partial [Trifolium medium]|nr:hypothetical protein [Trifolium medium]
RMLSMSFQSVGIALKNDAGACCWFCSLRGARWPWRVAPSCSVLG